MQIDLQPHEYSVRGRKEPILAKGWWIGVLMMVALFAAIFAKVYLTRMWING
jgi:hypothetical protein